ncbi:unnamed protein product, partial [marine sediment metagenome]
GLNSPFPDVDWITAVLERAGVLEELPIAV